MPNDVLTGRPKRTDLEAEIALFERSFGFFSYNWVLTNPEPVLRKAGIAETAFDDVAANAFVNSCIASRKAKTYQKEWKLLQGQVSDATFNEYLQLYNDLDVEMITEQILDTPSYGFQPLEIIWNLSNKYWYPTDLIAKPRTWFHYDPEGQLRFKSKKSPVKGEPIPEFKFIVPRHGATYQQPYGNALMARCYWSVFFMNNIKQFELLYSEKYGMPIITAEYDPELLLKSFDVDNLETAVDKLKEVLSYVRKDGLLIFPKGVSVDIIKPEASNAHGIYEKIIEDCKDDISRVILGHTAATKSTPGRLGNENTAQEVRADITGYDTQLVQWVFNMLNYYIYLFNFSNEPEYPLFELYEETEVETNKVNSEIATNMVNAGIILKPEYWKRTQNLLDNEFEINPNPNNSNSSNPTNKERQQFKSSLGLLLKLSDLSDEITDNRKSIDSVLEFFEDPKFQQEMFEPIIKPVYNYINKQSDYDSALKDIADVYPNMDYKELNQFMEKLFIIAQLYGEQSVEFENEAQKD